MRSFDDQFLYLFIHVPKCLGTTLTDAIGGQIPESVHVYRDPAGLTREQIIAGILLELKDRAIPPARLRVIHGHGVFEGMRGFESQKDPCEGRSSSALGQWFFSVRDRRVTDSPP